MATVFNPGFDEDDDQQQAGGGQQLAGESGVVGSGMGGGQQQAAPSAPKGSGSFVNLKSYLDANQGASGAMANKVSGYVGGEADKGTTALTGVNTSFGQDVQKGTVQFDQGLADKAKTGSVDTGALSTAYNQQYSGPGVQQYQDQAAGAKKALENAYGLSQQAGSFGGNQSLLKKTYGGPSYTRGLSSLDSALITRDGESRGVMSGVKQKYSGLTGLYDQGLKDAGTQVTAANVQTGAVQQQYKDAIGQGIGKIDSTVQSRVTDATTEAQRYQDLLKRVQGDAYKPQAVTAPTRESMMTPQEVAQYNALQAIINGKPMSGSGSYGQAGGGSAGPDAKSTVSTSTETAAAQKAQADAAVRDIMKTTGFNYETAMKIYNKNQNPGPTQTHVNNIFED